MPRASLGVSAVTIDSVIDQHHASGAAAWPTIAVSREQFGAEVKARSRSDDGIRALAAADMYIAIACSDGDPIALAAFRDAYVPGLRKALGKLGMPAATIDDVVQRVLVMVFVGDGAPPQIASYSGRGTLRSWLRTIAIRTGRRQLGLDHDAANGNDELDDLPTAVADPELEMLRARYRDQVKQAFAAGFAELSERERNILRQYHIDGLTIDQLAGLYQVNRATTARWVTAARVAVVSRTRHQLVSRFGIAASEVDSIIRLVRSQLDLSVREIAN
jgi:RNA polymerase sigma-70 factor (ECF subfamily)